MHLFSSYCCRNAGNSLHIRLGWFFMNLNIHRILLSRNPSSIRILLSRALFADMTRFIHSPIMYSIRALIDSMTNFTTFMTKRRFKTRTHVIALSMGSLSTSKLGFHLRIDRNLFASCQGPSH